MERHAFAFAIRYGKYNEFRQLLGTMWSDVTDILDAMRIQNFSLWGIEDLVFGYYEMNSEKTLPTSKSSQYGRIRSELDKLVEWISTPAEEMRLMYQDFGIVRDSKELIRHRVFATRLRPGAQEEYKRRHDALVEARGDKVDPGPDSNFSIWNAGDYIFGYDEIDTSMEVEETEEQRRNTIDWETKMLGIMAWFTDDVDWITGLEHKHIVRLAHHN
ncbi:MAG: L-rhamnose mutarotase [Lachnospiraceae bacterium]|nr:L-rhamnose mutarotase [Lachnospiraceae bacterium]